MIKCGECLSEFRYLLFHFPTHVLIVLRGRGRKKYVFSRNDDYGAYNITVEPLIKATPDVRTPLYTGHFADPECILLVQEIRHSSIKDKILFPNSGHYT